MAYKIGTMTQGTTGVKTLNLGTPSTPTAVTFVVQSKRATADADKHISIGTATPSGQRVTSQFKDATGTFTADDLTKCISHYERIGGVVTEILSASFVGFTSNGCQINVTMANVNYDIYYRADY